MSLFVCENLSGSDCDVPSKLSLFCMAKLAVPQNGSYIYVFTTGAIMVMFPLEINSVSLSQTTLLAGDPK